ncbi:hypothetical protein FJTKL_01036 [Diaporthe vaccinii]|uniref:Amine oxidase domain-containing protein n=1 Tax=Diaporthe vaccinii TaxID=105482 RepID=A0ABR4E1H6_9PEZI
MFLKTEGYEQFAYSHRSVTMASYTFEIQLAAKSLDRIFPRGGSLDLVEAGASQVFPTDELVEGSAFCSFGPTQKSQFLSNMQAPDRDGEVCFAGEQVSFTRRWIQGAFEAALRCVQQIWDMAVAPKAQ